MTWLAYCGPCAGWPCPPCGPIAQTGISDWIWLALPIALVLASGALLSVLGRWMYALETPACVRVPQRPWLPGAR